MNWNREVEELLKDSASLDQENKDIREKRPPAAAILRLAHDLSRRPQTNFPFGTKMIFQKKKKVKNKWERGNPLMLYMLIVCVCVCVGTWKCCRLSASVARERTSPTRNSFKHFFFQFKHKKKSQKPTKHLTKLVNFIWKIKTILKIKLIYKLNALSLIKLKNQYKKM